MVETKQVTQKPEELHKGATSDIAEMIDNNNCSRQYYALEMCLGANDRSWSKCQDAVKLLKVCSDARKNSGKQ